MTRPDVHWYSFQPINNEHEKKHLLLLVISSVTPLVMTGFGLWWLQMGNPIRIANVFILVFIWTVYYILLE